MPRYNIDEVVDAPVNEAEIGNESTMRQLCEFFIEKNQHHFTKGLLIRLQKSVSNFKQMMDMKYKGIPDSMLDTL